MAKLEDIDIKAAVGKFLQRQIIIPSTDDQSDTEEEIEALLEQVALSFLLVPQSALPIILRSRNALVQISDATLSLLTFLRAAIRDILNPDPQVQNTSDLVEAQTALLELDRLGRVDISLRAFDRYDRAVQRFLDDQLSPSLKRHRRGEFERTGKEARIDIFQVLSSLRSAYALLLERVGFFTNSVNEFRGVDLTRIVSSRTVDRVRRSLRKVRDRISEGKLSKTAAAIELLAGSAALESISKTSDIYDPTVETGSIPEKRTIRLRPEQVPATVLSSEGPWVLSGSSWIFEMTIDPSSSTPVAVSEELPSPGADDSVYLTSSKDKSAPTFDIPTNGTLYISVEGASTQEQEIAVTSGSSVSFSTIVSDLNSGLVDASCIELGSGTNRFLIYGDPGVTKITIRSQSSGDGGTVNSDPSVHELLGFIDGQTSLPKGTFTAESLVDALESRVSKALFEVEGDRVRISSKNETSRVSSLEFPSGSGVQDQFGFNSELIESNPSYVELVENGEFVDPESLQVFVGSSMTAAEEFKAGVSLRTLNNAIISSISGTKIFLDQSPLPREPDINVTVVSPAVLAVQKLIRKLNRSEASEADMDSLQRALAPLLSRPTPAQIGDAQKEVDQAIEKVTEIKDILTEETIRPDRVAFRSEGDRILRSLEERGLDRAFELLVSGQFSEFFALSKNVASRSSRFLRAVEEVRREDVPSPTTEVDQPENRAPFFENPENILEDTELSGEDVLVSEE